MNLAGVPLSAVSDRYPALRHVINGSWRSFAAWGRLEPAQRAKPVSVLVLQLLLHSLFSFATAENVLTIFVIACHCLLVYSLFRSAEVLSLRWRDVTFDYTRDGQPFLSIAVEGRTSGRKGIVEYVSVVDAFFLFSYLRSAPSSRRTIFCGLFRRTSSGGFFPYFKRQRI